jgi:GAF domain-containing protein
MGADDYITKPFSARELMARIQVNIKLSHVRRRLITEQRHQLETKKLLFAIGNKIRSGFGLQETLDTAVSEVKKVLSCDSLLIAQRIFEKDKGLGCKVMAASLNSDKPEEIVGNVFRNLVDCGNAAVTSSEIHPEPPIHHCDGHLMQDSLSDDLLICTDCESQLLHRRVSFFSIAIHQKSSLWGWIVAYREPFNKWSESEMNFLQQVSNQISLAIGHATLIEEKIKHEAQVKAIRETNRSKSKILTNTSLGK